MDVALVLPTVEIQQMEPAELKDHMAEYCVVDIRGKERSKLGQLVGTQYAISIFELPEAYSKLPKDKPLVIYDTADQMTLTAGRFLAFKGYTVKRLGGGVVQWSAAGFPMEKVGP